MSAKMDKKDLHCAERSSLFGGRKLLRRLFFSILFLVFLILLTIFIIYLVLRPSKPGFTLTSASISRFNLSTTDTPFNYSPQPSPPQLTSTLQVTLSSHNPNSRIGVLYDRLDARLEYGGQQLTLSTPAVLGSNSYYQGHHEVAVWSPLILHGEGVPLAHHVAAGLAADVAGGTVMMRVRAAGRVRWKVGSWTSGTYRIEINCPATFGVDGSGPTATGKLQRSSQCSVSV